jgi:hypothetical protein
MISLVDPAHLWHQRVTRNCRSKEKFAVSCGKDFLPFPTPLFSRTMIRSQVSLGIRKRRRRPALSAQSTTIAGWRTVIVLSNHARGACVGGESGYSERGAAGIEFGNLKASGE